MKTNTAKIVRHTLGLVALSVCQTPFGLTSQAQIAINTPSFYQLLKEYSFDKNPHLHISDDEYNENIRFVKVYDTDFNIYHEFSHPLRAKVPTKIVTEERYVIPGKFEEETVDEEVHSKEYGNFYMTLEQFRNLAYERGCTEETSEGDTYTFLPPSLPEEGTYNKYVYQIDSYYTIYIILRHTAYGEWQATGEETRYRYTQSPRNFPDFLDFDSNSSSYDLYAAYTQTLFNDDENFEYFEDVYEIIESPDNANTKETDWVTYPGKSIPIKREMSYDARHAKTKVISENGNTIAEFKGNVEAILRFGGKTYVVSFLTDYSLSKPHTAVFYEINHKTGSVQQVREFNVNIYPGLIRRNEFVTVETGDNLAESTREVIVSSMDGSIIEHCHIPVGEKSIRINTSRMNSGIYNFTITANGERIENGKIIVK